MRREGDGKARATIATGAREGGGSYTTPGVVPPVMPTRLVSARTYESEPARGTPVSAIETRPRPQTIVRTQDGVFAFVSPMFADMDDPQVRAVMEREFARELGLPEGELPVDLEHFMLARQLSRVVRLFALIDMVLCVLYALSGVSVIAVLLIGPLAGFVGARMYNPGLTACYVAFCVASIVWRDFEFRLYEKCHRARAVGDHHHLSDVHHAIGDSVLSRRARDTARGTNFASATRLRELGGARGLNVIFNVQ